MPLYNSGMSLSIIAFISGNEAPERVKDFLNLVTENGSVTPEALVTEMCLVMVLEITTDQFYFF